MVKPDFMQLALRRREPTEAEVDQYTHIMREFAQYQLWRNTFAAQWEEVAELIHPGFRNTFFYGSFNWPGMKKTDRQVDASGQMALHRFAAICDSLLTPRNSMWHQLGSNNQDLMKSRRVRLWYEQATRVLFQHRYAAHANFSAQNQNNYQSLGAFGTGNMFIDEFEGTIPQPGLRYKAIPLGEMFLGENHQGMVDRFIRWFRLTARQIYQRWPETFPAQLVPALESESQTPFDILHRVGPREDYDPARLDAKGKPFSSIYLCIQGQTILREGGYRKFPVASSRYDQMPGEVYGRSPAMMVLPALKTLNNQKRVFLKQGHRAGDPVLLTADDGVVDMSLRPGAVNKGGVNSDGKELVKVLPFGSIDVNEKMMDMERNLINDAFLVTLFQILTESPQMTATEVIERTNEKGILIAPTLGRQQSEYLGPLIDRELDLLAWQRLLPPMPPELVEAKGEYETVYTSPLSRAQKAQEAAGFSRSVEIVKELVAVTQDPSLLDPFDFKTAIPAIAAIQAVPESWMSSPEEISKKEKKRAAAQARQEQIQAAPAQAAMIKANAVAAQAGQQPQQPQPGGPQQ